MRASGASLVIVKSTRLGSLQKPSKPIILWAWPSSRHIHYPIASDCDSMRATSAELGIGSAANRPKQDFPTQAG
jgi:hypothetical protein